jgi:hypothetical protein
MRTWNTNTLPLTLALTALALELSFLNQAKAISFTTTA